MTGGYVPAVLRRQVDERAGDCCEYCLIPASVVLVPHQVDHIIAQKHGGETEIGNLALSCAICNKYKGTDLASLDPETGELTPLFHPRRDRWADHFRLDQARIEPRTAVGRATERLLQLNRPERIAEREILLLAGALRIPD